jgi:hypothetical protein
MWAARVGHSVAGMELAIDLPGWLQTILRVKSAVLALVFVVGIALVLKDDRE